MKNKLYILAFVALCFAVVAVGKSNAAGVDYSVGSTQYCAQSVAQTPQDMIFHGWTIGQCGGGTNPPPAGLYASGRLSYGGKGGFITNANLLDWAVLWGRSGVQTDPVPFPGASGATPVWTPGANQYTCSKFRTPAGGLSGQYKNSAYYSTGAINISLSTTCGDFTPAQPACHKENVPNNDQPKLFWDINGAGTFRCHLPANTDVFLNVKRTSPTAQLAISVIGQQG